ncbi:dethiobiotin synthase [Gluconacetobacter diazotrophicus PA1 5]|uniref:ATP-dependent dethiobiotin synthetase BioD n=1 Tax=Gluconacetobacter diazotrophicus (strain ATCC 49037 / DSM 5601 / CCUG 37298 / CIP 103539 / LMG 7603 / PAl5) TaxID=272568 RepID=A9HJ62_GLUDA|nr:dethiobiotin synthase [Gluconacetobacter diazotrophicus]ACI49944.1 dethiobiotin synthase [Gluconacetobacter diazotrophicus PA1 5]TWB05988.1 malonyl-CoA O-methyltransferase [Gluconacetobacter diazotrophicus]CAP55865.1 putative biotin synthesis protein [Gluconacetobacter diazotrophicus PA1 5]
MNPRKHQIAARFGGADSYDAAARIQASVAARLADRIRAACDAAGGLAPARILELGCGTGFLSAHLRRLFPDAILTVTDLAPEMVERARARLTPLGGDVRYAVVDAEDPASVGTGFDLICSSLSMQWFTDPAATLDRLAARLAPGGMMALSTLCAGSFAEWRAVHRAAGLDCPVPSYPGLEQLQADWPGAGVGSWRHETLIDHPASALDFVRELRQIGASLPRDGARPAGPGTMRRLLRDLDNRGGVTATYEIGYGLFRTPSRRGVFVTGTDTEVGKTLAAACLVQAWNASYWKPLQTGIAEDTADSVTIAALCGVDPARIARPAVVLPAPLSPFDAAEQDGITLDAARIVLPPARDARPVVVEGAGGVMVPITRDCMMIDLMVRFALPVVVVARSQLGTINHTLLTLQALRSRGLAVAGVILNGQPSREARRAITLFGGARVLAEFPHLDQVGPEQVANLAGLLPSYDDLWCYP